jgi:arsenite methyltransferase
MNPLVKPLSPSAATVVPAGLRGRETATVESLFEQFAWIYIFCRENVFRDDTSRIIRRLWGNGAPPPQAQILEVGCGPGFYARTLAARFPRAQVIGIDKSKRLLEYARVKARENDVTTCRFERGNVLNLDLSDDSCHAVIASRLFTVLPERERALAEMFRVVAPSGKCFVAEPRFAFSASIPLLVMRSLARLNGSAAEYREPAKAMALSAQQFRALFETQPWARIEIWRAGRYQYALCEKD